MPKSPYPDDQRFFFVHLQKTGGTTVYLLLRRWFSEPELYPGDIDTDRVPSIISVPYLMDQWAGRKDQLKVVTGHFPYCVKDMLGQDIRTFTILREPVERTLSYLRHHRKLTPADSEKSLEEIYEDPFRFDALIQNHMVKMLSLTTEEMTDGALTKVNFDSARFDRAKENLAAVDVVGLQDNYDAFWDALSEKFGWDLGAPAITNKTEGEDVSQSFRDRIAEDNAMDIEFYEFAREMVG